MTAPLHRDPASFRDPAGCVFVNGERVLRSVTSLGAADYEHVRDAGALDELVRGGLVIPAREVDPGQLNGTAAKARYLLEHPRLSFLSYPYEWPFAALKAAALAHLEIQLRLIDRDIALVDASAYNVQFRGPRPIFIDYLSFRRYREGALWPGHRQFCEQFLNPLLLRALLGVPHNAWYSGSPEGLPSDQLNRMLPLGRKLSWRVLKHVVLPAKLQAAALHESDGELDGLKQATLPKAAFRAMLTALRDWIAALEPRDQQKTLWSDYTATRSYDSRETKAKADVIADFVATGPSRTVWDLGCNSGEFAEVALAAGAEQAVGFDADQGALDLAFARAEAKGLELLPLYLDAANPSSGRGWKACEKKSLAERSNADIVLALAFVHHLAIGRNIPLPDVVDWLVGLAPRGVIEFVQKSDTRVQRMLRFRDDIFDHYDEESFRTALSARARIVRDVKVSGAGRTLFCFDRR